MGVTLPIAFAVQKTTYIFAFPLDCRLHVGYNPLMNKKDIEQKIAAIENRISELPKGYISRKMIRGREQLYLQWREGGKVCSKFIKKADRIAVVSQVEERRELQEQLDKLYAELRKPDPAPGMSTAYMATGIATANMAAGMSTAYMEANMANANITAGMVAEKTAGYSASKGEAYTIKQYIKWEDAKIGFVDDRNNVHFTDPEHNEVVRLYTAGKTMWTKEEFFSFLRDRIVSSSRRDIETLLRRMGLTEYDVFDVAAKTHMICAKDRLWLADEPDEKYEEAVTDVFRSVFLLNVDSKGDSVDTPEGQNIKRYGVFDANYGIYKKRLSPLITDVESELAAYALANRLGVPCCRAVRVDEDTMFSVFEYDFNREYIVHFRRLIENYRDVIDEGRMPQKQSRDLLTQLIAVRPGYLKDFARMIAFDFITRQDDRHLSNIAVKISPDDSSGESFYPLYDNGRCLFYEDTEETVKRACRDIRAFASSFGQEGSYYDHVKNLSEMGISFPRIMDLDIDRKQILAILEAAGFTGYRLRGAEKWITKCIGILKQLY